MKTPFCLDRNGVFVSESLVLQWFPAVTLKRIIEGTWDRTSTTGDLPDAVYFPFPVISLPSGVLGFH